MSLFAQQFYMTNIKSNMDDLQTRIDTPFKTQPNGYYQINQSPNKQSVEYISKENHLSQTQTHLNSRQIVRKLLKTTKSRTVRHQINQISSQSPLYSKPSRYNSNQFQFNHIPPSDHNYASSCSAKIKQINQGFQKKQLPSQRATRYQSQTRPSSSVSEQKHQQRVSISGLITYKFHSINAERSLGFNRINHEQTLKEEIKNSRKNCLCPNNRFKKILLKNSHKKYQERLRQEKNIMSNFENSTDQYLNQRIKQNEEELLIYGQKARKLHFIKDYMYSEGANYNEGRHIIDQIERHQPKEDNPTKRTCKTEIDEDLQLQLRKIPVNRKRINIRFLTFID